MADLKYTNLVSSTSSFDEMMRKFGVVTVMNAKVYEALPEEVYEYLIYNGSDAYYTSLELDKDKGNARVIAQAFVDEVSIEEVGDTGFAVTEEVIDGPIQIKKLCELKTLKIANVTVEGPTKTITGGQYGNILVKYGKTARLEMQDALGNAEALEALAGALVEYDDDQTTISALHNGSDFSKPVTIIGDTFFLNEKGQQIPVTIIFYRFNPDSLFNLTQDAEGDATVFDLNGDLLMTNIKVSTQGVYMADGEIVDSETADAEWTPLAASHGVFYSILDRIEALPDEE
jgi:hypothetical protein